MNVSEGDFARIIEGEKVGACVLVLHKDHSCFICNEVVWLVESLEPFEGVNRYTGIVASLPAGTRADAHDSTLRRIPPPPLESPCDPISRKEPSHVPA